MPPKKDEGVDVFVRLRFLRVCFDVSTQVARCHSSQVHPHGVRQVVAEVVAGGRPP